ncbi:unnamed protein product [Miscanthus lutarioriparius]|uniref:Uncharacterized protein n=1 Tax=Miscanthus lutarioriparius TaxID=422564 RepID=A0A811PTX1_9POAL|nr:unnamed protein product [Miscanthus lutarioriparius]
MAGFIYAKQQTSTTPTEAAAGFRGWSFAQEDPHPSVRHVHAGGTCSRGLPAQARHKNEEKPVHFIPGISNSRPSHQVPEEQFSSKPTSSLPRPVPSPVGFIREALQHQKAEPLKEKARQKVASLIWRK